MKKENACNLHSDGDTIIIKGCKWCTPVMNVMLGILAIGVVASIICAFISL